MWVEVASAALSSSLADASAPAAGARTPPYAIDILKAGPQQLPVLLVHVKDGRRFALVDRCPPTGHTLCYGAVDPDILSIEDAAFGTRFDLRTGKVRGPWCPRLGSLASRYPVKALQVLPCREGDRGGVQILLPKET